MSNIITTYMGVSLENPVVVGACSLSKRIDTIRQIEDAGAGGLVVKSLFEEQIQHEQGAFEDRITRYDDIFAEAVSMFPRYEHAGARQHLKWLGETRKAVKMPLFASLNAVKRETWIEYAKELENTGVDGLELNFYSPPLDSNMPSVDIEMREIETLADVTAAVSIPVSVKLHPFYTSLMHHAKNLQEAGAKALVLFNRLFEPDIDLAKEAKKATLHLSSADDSRVPLRWIALLSGQTQCDLIASTGIMSGLDVAKMLLAGAQAVQVASTVFRNGIGHIGQIKSDLETWMQDHQYDNIGQFRGKVARQRADDPWHFERGQYIKAVIGFD